ncbi:MAG: hypothetical protein LQ345_002910 [Seirophora villosa]|nr:MAG: hypothetical protein LQ345_002910 [Seirophora villosa]
MTRQENLKRRNRVLRSSNRPHLATIPAPNPQPVTRKRKRSPMPLSSKPTQRNGHKTRLKKIIRDEEETAIQNGSATRSRRSAPKRQPSLSASNRSTRSDARNPDQQDPATYRNSAAALDQLSDMSNGPTPLQVHSSRKRSQSPVRAPSPSKESSSDKSQNSRTVTKKESLALMSPPVRFAPFATIAEPGRGLPPLAQRLWMHYLRPACSSTVSCIPDTLKDRLEALSSTPSGRQPQIAPGAFCTPARHRLQAPLGTPSEPFAYHPADHEYIAEVVFDVHRMAETWRNRCHEDYWIDIVVAPLVHLVRKLTNFHVDGDKNQTPRLAVINLKSTEIKPTSLISTTDADLFKALNKNINLAIGLNLFQSQLRELQMRRYSLQPTNPSINQVQSYFHLTPMFVNIEVKKEHQAQDPLIQLGAWVAAEFNKRSAEEWPMDMPVVAIEIERDRWSMYIVYHVPKDDGRFSLRFLGPKSMGTTSEIEGIFRILYVLCTLAKWGEEVYRGWFYGVHGLSEGYDG